MKDGLNKTLEVLDATSLHLSSTKAFIASLTTYFAATFSGWVTKENVIFTLTAVLIVCQIASYLYRLMVYHFYNKNKIVPDGIEDGDLLKGYHREKKKRKR